MQKSTIINTLNKGIDFIYSKTDKPQKIVYKILGIKIIKKKSINITSYSYPQELCKWYKQHTDKELDLANPKTFSEKVQWLKLYDSTEIKTKLTDKLLVREWIKEKIGDTYLINLIGVYDNPEKIDFSKLPESFVIKCNHGSGYNIVVKNKNEINKILIMPLMRYIAVMSFLNLSILFIKKATRRVMIEVIMIIIKI